METPEQREASAEMKAVAMKGVIYFKTCGHPCGLGLLLPSDGILVPVGLGVDEESRGLRHAVSSKSSLTQTLGSTYLHYKPVREASVLLESRSCAA